MLPVFKILQAERRATEPVARQPESSMAMDGIEQSIQYNEASASDGPAIAVYLLHLPRMARLIRPGHRVLDLGCGNAWMVCKLAALFPKTEFVGLDLSKAMLERAEENKKETEREQGKTLSNLSFQEGSMLQLTSLKGPFDVIVSNFTVHHLPDFDSLEVLFQQIQKVLPSTGAFYISDFLRPKSEVTIQLMVEHSYHKGLDFLREDYRQSLHAAFSAEEIRQALAKVNLPAKMTKTKILDFMFAIHSDLTGEVPAELTAFIKATRKKMPLRYKMDEWALQFVFGKNSH